MQHAISTNCSNTRLASRAGTSSVRTLVWYPESGTDVNVTAVINTPGADYTTLASFGSAADFGQNVVNSMDRSFSLPKGGGPPKAPTMVRARCACAPIGTLRSAFRCARHAQPQPDHGRKARSARARIRSCCLGHPGARTRDTQLRLSGLFA